MSILKDHRRSHLDTLEQVVVFDDHYLKTDVKTDESLLKKVRSKFITNSLILRLVDVEGSPLHKAYWATYHCASAMEQKGKEIQTKHCGYRWCLVCNRNRAGELMNGYADVIKAFPDPHHLVLTKPTVKKEVLKEEMKKMQRAFKKCTRRLASRGNGVNGVRKLECTYNPVTNLYHPHFHVIIETFKQGKELKEEWMKEYPNVNFNCQPLDRANEGGLMELLKYFTKILPSKASKATGQIEIHPKALDTMFVAMKGNHTFRPFGTVKKKTDQARNKSQSYDIPERDYTVWVWEQDIADYVDFLTLEPLTGYVPDEKTMEFVDVIRGRQAKSTVK
jgi:hypothetical protein